MKKILFLILFLPPFHFTSFGTDYFDGNFQAALDSAKKYDKLIFMNIAATWSGASNRMEETVFRDDETENQIGTHFLPIRFDASSEEGLKIQQQFGITALPAFLVINSQGQIVRLRIGEISLEAFRTFLKDALTDPNGYQNLEKETLESFNSSMKTPNDYSWSSYNFNYLISKPEIALTLYTANNYRPKGVASKLEVFNTLVNCARKAGKNNNIALLSELQIYAEKIGFVGREKTVFELFYHLERNDAEDVQKSLLEFGNNKDRFSDFQFTGVVFSELVRSISEIYYRTADSETLLATLEKVNSQNSFFERVYPERIYKYYKSILLTKVGHLEEAKVIAKTIMKTYEFVPADKNYDETITELEKIVDERE